MRSTWACQESAAAAAAGRTARGSCARSTTAPGVPAALTARSPPEPVAIGQRARRDLGDGRVGAEDQRGAELRDLVDLDRVRGRPRARPSSRRSPAELTTAASFGADERGRGRAPVAAEAAVGGASVPTANLATKASAQKMVGSPPNVRSNAPASWGSRRDGLTGDVDVAGRVDARRRRRPRSPSRRGTWRRRQRRAGRVEPGDVGVGRAAVELGVERVRRREGGRRAGAAGQPDVAGRVRRHGGRARLAEERRVDERATRSALSLVTKPSPPRNVVSNAPGVVGIVRRERAADDVGVAGRVDGEVVGEVAASSRRGTSSRSSAGAGGVELGDEDVEQLVEGAAAVGRVEGARASSGSRPSASPPT